MADHPHDAAIVVEMRMGVDDRHDRLVAAMLAVEVQCRLGGLSGDQRVHDDHPLGGLNEGDIAEIQATNLVDVIGHFEQAGIVLHDLGLAPETGIDRVRRRLITLEKIELGQIPDDVTLGVLDHTIIFQRGDKTFFGILEGLLVAKRQLLEHSCIRFLGGLAGGFGCVGSHDRLTETDSQHNS